MMRSLYSGVAGLKTHQTKMDVIGRSSRYKCKADRSWINSCINNDKYNRAWWNTDDKQST